MIKQTLFILSVTILSFVIGYYLSFIFDKIGLGTASLFIQAIIVILTLFIIFALIFTMINLIKRYSSGGGVS